LVSNEVKMNKFMITTWAVVFFLLASCGPLIADDNGQVININQNYQIVFTDLGSRVLKQGDIVRVSLNADEFIYLLVLESSAILSKLGPSKVEGFQTNLSEFQRLAVGNEVAKVNQKKDDVGNPAADISAADAAGELSQLQIQKLEQDLGIAKEEIKYLQKSNEASKLKLSELAVEGRAKNEEHVSPVQVDNKQVLDQLKVHLDNMRKLIDENN